MDAQTALESLSELEQALLCNAFRDPEGLLHVVDRCDACIEMQDGEDGVVSADEDCRIGLRRALFALVMRRLLVALDFGGRVYSLTERGLALAAQLLVHGADSTSPKSLLGA